MFFAAIVPLLPELSDDFGLTKTGAGILAAAYPAGTLLGSLPGGWLAARLGVRATMIVGLGLLIGSSITFAFADSIVVLDLARFVQGLGSAASWAGALGWLIGASPRERRGELIGSAMGAAIVGALLGPVLGAAAASLGTEAVFTAVGVASGGLLVWALLDAVEPDAAAYPDADGLRRPERPAHRDRHVDRDPRRADVRHARRARAAAARRARGDRGVIGVTFVAAGALEATMSPFFGRLSDRHGRILPCLVGLGAAGVAMLLLPWPEATVGARADRRLSPARASGSCGRRRWRCCPTAPTTSASTRATRSR